jgi:hypothetical protein
MMEEPTLLQTGPESFRILFGGGRVVEAQLPHHTRRGLGLHGVPPLVVATEMVRFLLERDALVGDEVALGPAVGRYPESVEELRTRLT